MDEHRDDYEGILGKALERITRLNEANTSLTLELEEANSRLSSQVDPASASQLQEENDSLKSQLENARKQLKALKDIVTKSLGDLSQEAKHLTKKIEATYTVLDLYDLLYDVEPPAGASLRRDEAPVSLRQPDQVVAVEKRLRVVHHEEPEWKNEDQPVPDTTLADQSFEAEPIIASEQELPLVSDMTDTGGQSNEIDLIVSAFSRFDTINKFTAAVRGISGVADAKVRHFQKGTLRMAVQYEGMVPFANRLRELTLFKLRIESASSVRVTATLDLQESAAFVSSAV